MSRLCICDKTVGVGKSMAVNTELIKQLREMTGAGVLDCKKALDETEGDVEEAAEILRQQGLVEAAEKADREAAEGLVEAYVHATGKLASLVEVNCETDFVARTDEFETLCHDIAMQVAATAPRWVAREDVPEEVVAELKESFREEFADDNKPAHVMERIMEGKLNKFYEENCLLEQPFIKDDEKTIQQLVTEAIATMGENIVVARFARFAIE